MILISYNVAVVKDGDIFVLAMGALPPYDAIRGDMTPTQDGRHVFIVRIWLEPREIEGAAPQLRGTIEHVPSGARGGIKALHEITAFIRAWLPEAGGPPGIWKRLNRRLRNRRDLEL